MTEIPKKYQHAEAERRWAERWEEWGIHRWDPTRPREETFVVDTPPPTVSGSLHVGHVFSYTHQDLIVRYQRMRGRNIAYPMGWDDNGLPTERRVQNVFGIRCNARVPYDPSWKPQRIAKDGVQVEVSRPNFIEACEILTAEDEKAFEDLFRHLGLSVDWTLVYATIDERCRRVSQLSFLDMVKKDLVYHAELPTMWDVDFQTAVAQAEIEDREIGGAYHDIRFGVEGGGDLTISTTRPELLGACIAVVAHPSDERYQGLFGKTAITPLFHAPVPILAAEHADPEKGTGILMVCTFGDSADVEWWRSSGLELKELVGRDGKLMDLEYGEGPYVSRDPAAARAAYGELKGLWVKQARKRIVELLQADGSLVAELRPTMHPVKFYEKGDRPLEFVPTRQWFVRILDNKEPLLALSRRIQWHPAHMLHRIEHWIEGLNQDWCISRQRFFGVPFPVWYPVRADGSPDYERPIYASADDLPVDPLSQTAPGYTEDQRDVPGGFTGDPDVMDTWATSSLTPQVTSHWGTDDERHRKLFPADVRPQAHDIIRTWAFYTIVKGWIHENEVPWHHAIISGWILDPDRKKMSKSKGNVVTPGHLLEQHSADAVRYWAARARLGTDTAFKEEVFEVGKRLATKLFNASRFVLMQLDRDPGGPRDLAQVTEPLDQALLARLRKVVADATSAFDEFEYALALQATEGDFWAFCDDYVELVKRRSYEEEDTAGRRSAMATLYLALRTFLRLFAPFLPYITEEVWSWRFEGSVHTSAWPTVEELDAPAPAEGDVYGAGVEVLRKLRQAKTVAQKKLRWPVASLTIRGSAEDLRALEPVLADVLLAGAAETATVTKAEGAAPEGGDRFAVEVVLAEEDVPSAV